MHSWRDILIEWEAVWNQYLNDDRAFSRPLSPLSHPQPSSHAPSTSFPEHPQLNSRQIYLHTIPRCPHTTFHSSQVSRGCCGPELNAGRETFTKSTEKTHVPCCCRIVGSFRLRRTMHISTRGQRGVGLWEKMLTYFPKPPHYIFKLFQSITQLAEMPVRVQQRIGIGQGLLMLCVFISCCITIGF